MIQIHTFGKCMKAVNLPSSYIFLWLVFKLPILTLLGAAVLIFSEKKIFIDSNQKIIVYDKNRNNVANYTPCLRCYGAGEFPQFNHVQSGICFRCLGAKYEELIEGNTHL